MSNSPLTDRVAIITGASRGLGHAVATALRREGMHVALTARSSEVLERVAEELRAEPGGGQVFVRAGDVTDPGEVAATVAEVESTLGAVDLLVNNAGLAEASEVPIWEADPDEWWSVMTTNLRGPALFSRFVVPTMVANGRGRIVNINSMRGMRAQSTQTAYAVSKGGLAVLTKSLAAGLEGTGVQVFDYSPGRVRTDLSDSLVALGSMSDDSWTPMERATDGVLAIASGALDELSGCFVHAHDDFAELADRAQEIVDGRGRRLELTEAFSGDPLNQRGAGTAGR